MLTNASAAGAGAPVATSGSGAGAASAKASYRLDGTETTLTPHVGHKVEITGTLEEQRPGSGAAAGATAGAANASAGTLKVDSVKMVSTTCP